MLLPLRPSTTLFINGPAKLARFLLQGWRLIGLQLRACSEHCPQCSNSIYLLCALREHGRPTASIPHFLRAHSGSTGAAWVAILYFLLCAMCVECVYGTTRQIGRSERTYPTSQCVERACVSGEIGRSPTTVSCATPSPRPGTIRHLPRVAARVFAQALTEIVRRLDDARTHHLLDQYALIGGFAVAAWGVPRATHDLDFALALGSADPAALSRHLNARFHSGEAEDPLRGCPRCGAVLQQCGATRNVETLIHVVPEIVGFLCPQCGYSERSF